MDARLHIIVPMGELGDDACQLLQDLTDGDVQPDDFLAELPFKKDITYTLEVTA